MAQVPTDVTPSILATPDRPNDYQNVSAATPAAFGSQVGQAAQSLGANLAQTGQNVADVANMQQNLINKGASTDEVVNFSKQKADLDAKFFSLQGQAASDAFPDYQKSLEDLRDNSINKMQNPVAQDMVRQDVQRQIAMGMGGAARFVADQNKKWTLQSNDSAASAQVQAAMSPAVMKNPDAVELLAKQGQMSIRQNAITLGLDPATGLQQEANYRGNFYSTVLRNLALTDPLAAQTMYAKVAPTLDAASQLRINEFMKPAVDKAVTDGQFEMLTNQGGLIPRNVPFDQLSQARDIAESGGKQFQPGTQQAVTSPAGAIGRTQMMPATAQEVSAQIGEPYSLERLQNDEPYNQKLGDTYLQKQIDTFQDPNLALAAYNAGPGAVKAAIQKAGTTDPSKVLPLLPQETQKYVTQIGGSLRAKSGVQNPVSYTDMGPLIQKAIEMNPGDPEAQQRLIGKLGQWHSEQDAMTSQQRGALNREVENLKPALLNGQEGLTIPEQKIRQLYPPDKADEIVNDLNLAQTAGQVFKNVALASPDQLADYQKQLVTGQGLLPQLLRGKQNMPTDASGNLVNQGDQLADMKTRTSVANMLQGMIQKRNTMLKEDPASYAVNNDPGVGLAAKQASATGTTEDFNTYAHAVLDSQTRLGVPSYAQHILTNDQVQSAVRGLMSGDPSKEDIGMKVDQMANQYGDQWPQVFGELVTKGKLPSDWQTVAAMDLPTQVAARQDLIRSIQTFAEKGGAKEVAKAVPEQTMKDITANLGTNPIVQQFNSTAMIPGAAGNPGLVGTVQDSIKKLAMYYGLQGMDGQDAVTKAAQGVLGSKYDFDGTMRAPIGMMPQVRQMTSQTASSLKPEDLKDPGFLPGQPAGDLTPLQRQEALAKGPKTWAPNEKDDGLVMLYNGLDGSKIPVRRADGSRVEVKFSDIKSNSPSIPNPMTPDDQYRAGGY